MFARVVFLGTKDRANLKHTFQSIRHHDLFIELRTLIYECLVVEVRDGEELCSALCRSCHHLWRLNLDKITSDEKRTHYMKHFRANEKNSPCSRKSHVHKARVKPRIEFSRHFARNVKRER